jgi:hypothetical protein
MAEAKRWCFGMLTDGANVGSAASGGRTDFDDARSRIPGMRAVESEDVVEIKVLGGAVEVVEAGFGG